MKSKTNTVLCFLVMLTVIFSLCGPHAVYAEETAASGANVQNVQSVTDTAGNRFSGNAASIAQETIDRDLYWTGNTLSMENNKIGGDGILAGYTISLSDCQFDGSLRAGAYKLSISAVQVKNNITAAGYEVSVGADTKSAGTYLAGYSVKYSGTSDALYAAASTVVLDGTVNGDAEIYADNVQITDRAVVTGSLKVTAANEPEVPAGAKIGTYSFSYDKSDDERADAAKKSVVSSILSWVKTLVQLLIIGLLLCLLMGKELDGSGRMLRKHPVAVPISGLVSIFAVPLGVLILLISVIGVRAALLIAGFFILLLGIGRAFTGAALGRMIFPKLNKFLSSLIGVAAICILTAIPYLGVLVSCLCGMYTLGYCILCCYERLCSLSKKEPPATPPTPGSPDVPSPTTY